MSTSERAVIRLVRLLTIPVIVGVYGIAFYISVADLSIESALYPRISIVILLTLVLVEVVVSMRGWMRSVHGTDSGPTISEVWHQWRRSFYTVALVAFFLVAINVLGFYLSVLPFAAILLFALDVRNLKMIGAFTIGVLFVSYLLFETALSVPLPEGVFG